jgi:hypothetical protein
LNQIELNKPRWSDPAGFLFDGRSSNRRDWKLTDVLEFKRILAICDVAQGE